MGRRIGAAGLLQKLGSLRSNNGHGFLASLFSERNQAILEGYCLFETSPL
jgi:hypothetical protein